MEEKNYTDIDLFFKDQMAQESESGFDLPDDSVFAGAMEKVEKKNNRGLILFLFFIAGLSLAIIFSSDLFVSDAKLVQTSNQNLVSNKVEDKSFPEDQIKTQALINHKEPNSDQNTTSQSNRSNISNNSTNNITKVEKPSEGIIPILKEDENKALVEEEEATVISGEVGTPTPEININTELKILFVESSGLQLLQTPSRDLASPTFIDQKKTGQSPWSMFLFAEVLQTSFSMSNEQGVVVSELVDYDRGCWGFQTGLGLSQQISSKLRMDYHLSYTRLVNMSSYKSEMQYQSDNEYLTDAGELMYADQMNTETPVGVLNRSISFNTTSADLFDNEMMLAKTRTKQSYDIVGVGVTSSYELAQLGPFSLRPSLGFNAGYLVRLKHITDLELYYKDEMFHTDELWGKENDMVNRVFLSGEIGLDLSFRISDKLDNVFKVGYEQNLNSLRKSSPVDLTKTSYSSFFLGFSIRYSF